MSGNDGRGPVQRLFTALWPPVEALDVLEAALAGTETPPACGTGRCTASGSAPRTTVPTPATRIGETLVVRPRRDASAVVRRVGRVSVGTRW